MPSQPGPFNELAKLCLIIIIIILNSWDVAWCRGFGFSLQSVCGGSGGGEAGFIVDAQYLYVLYR